MTARKPSERLMAARATWSMRGISAMAGRMRGVDGVVAAARATTLVLWASGFAAIRVGVGAYSVGHLALLRFLIASIVLGILAVVRRISLPRPRDLPAIAVAGLMGFVAYNLLLAAGEVTVSAGAASLLTNTAPIFTALLATVFLREHLRWSGWLGSAIGFGGAALIAVGEGRAAGLSIGRGAFLVLGAAAAQACYFVLQKPLLARYRSLDLTTYAIWIGTLCLLPFLPGLFGALRAAPPAATAAVVYLGVLPSAVGHTTWAYALARSSASRSAGILYLTPAFAVVIAWFWLGERPAPVTLLGGALAVGGVVLLNARGRPSVS